MNNKGTSLIELLITLVIASFIMAGVYQVFIHEAKSYESQEQIGESQNAVRSGMETLVSDLRMAGYDREGGVVVTNPISGSSSSVRVEWEYNDTTLKAVQYFRSNNQLQRNVYLNGVLTEDSPQIVVDDVTDLKFAYVTSGSKIVRTDVTLAVKNRSLSSSIMLRNSK